MNLQENIQRIKEMMGKPKKETEVSRIIKKTAKEYNCSAWDINNGYCEDFAQKVINKLGDHGNNLLELSGDMFFNQRDIDFAKENWGDIIETKYGIWSKKMLEYWGYPPNVDLYLIDDEINHTWLYFNGKHYDAEVPNGVKNWYDIPLIERHLKKVINFNLQENIQRIKEMMGILSEQIDPTCEDIVLKNLKPAQEYWIKWLNDPVTKQKFMSNHQIDEKKQAEIFDKYFDVINSLKIVYYDKNLNSTGLDETSTRIKSEFKKNQTVDAFVLREYPKTIFFNCSSEMLDVLETMTHEIGHLIDFVHPLNPIKQVYNVFSDQMNIYIKRFNVKNLINSINKLGVTDPKEVEEIKQKYLKLYKNEQMKWDYVCDLWEKSVNINIIRKLFNLNPGENLTISHLKPYLLLEKELVSDIKWFIYCWIKLGFKDIEEMINRFNLLAKNQNQSKSNLA